MKFSEKVRNRELAVFADVLGLASVLKLFSGDVPHRCADADPVGEIATVEPPRELFNSPNGGQLHISQPWLGECHADGAAKSFRIVDHFGEVHIQGTVTGPEGNGDLKLDPNEMVAGQRVSISSFTLDRSDAAEERWERLKR